MAFSEKHQTAQYLDTGDDVTLPNGTRGTVISVSHGLTLLTMDNGKTVPVDTDGGMVTVVEDEGANPYGDLYGVEFVTIGDAIRVSGEVGTVTDVNLTDITVALATDDGITTVTLAGEDVLVYHNWLTPDNPDCNVCLRGQHHGPPEVRCTCCGRDLEIWSVDFAPTQS